LDEGIEQVSNVIAESNVVGTKGCEGKFTRTATTQVGDMEIAAKDKVVGKRREHLDAARLRSLERIPPLVRTFDSTPVCWDVLSCTSQASPLDLVELLVVDLVARMHGLVSWW
jgi:hypothetical protein